MTKKRKTKKEKINYRNRLEKNIKILEHLNEEKKELEEKEREAEKERRKEHIIKNLKIFKCLLNYASPLLISYAIIPGIGYISGAGLPIIEDTFTKSKITHISNDNNNLTIEDNYNKDSFFSDNSQDNILIIKTPWKKEDNNYTRYKRTYKVDNLYNNDLKEDIIKKDYEEINKLLNNYEETKETINYIPNNLNNNDYEVEIDIKMKNSEDKINYHETIKNNINTTLIETILSTITGPLLIVIREYDINHQLNNINTIYQYKLETIGNYQEEIEKKNKQIKKLKKSIGGLYNE